MAKPSQKKKNFPRLDLHAYKSDQVFDAVDKFILKHQSAKTTHMMTGKGKGIVQKKVIEYLTQAGYPWSYLIPDNGKPNTGILVVHMD